MLKKRELRESSLDIIKREVKIIKREKLALLFFLFATIFFICFLGTIILQNQLTGFATYIEGIAGTIYEIEAELTYPTYYWHGLYGLSLRVSGFTEQLFGDFDSGEISRQDLFFDCLQSGVAGGNEIFASLSPTINFDALVPATIASIDAYTGCSGEVHCATNTFKNNMSIMVGSRNISGIPATYTYRYDGNNSEFDLGVLNDSTNLVYVTHLEGVQRGYNYEKIVNYQLMLPTRPNNTETYYFFSDPYDECPAGGAIGESINASVHGRVVDINNTPLANASVSLGGQVVLSDSNGFYNLSISVITGVYNLIATKPLYDDYFDNVTINFTSYDIEKNIVLLTHTPGKNETIRPRVYGYVYDENGNIIFEANVSIGNYSTLSNVQGYYSFYPTLVAEPQNIISIKEGYNNYYALINFTNTTTSVNHNITMRLIPIYTYPYQTGPYSTQNPLVPIVQAIQEAQKKGQDYWVSTKEIYKEVGQNTFIEDIIGIYNFKGGAMNLVFSVSPSLQGIVKLEKSSMSIATNQFGNLVLYFYGNRPLGTYNGTLTISGSFEQEIPVSIKVVERRIPIETLVMELELFKTVVSPGEKIKYKVVLNNLLVDQNYKVFLQGMIADKNNSAIYYFPESEEIEIKNSVTLIRETTIPNNISEGEYLFKIDANYLNTMSSVSAPFKIQKPLYLYSVFGIPLWIILAIISFFSFAFLNFFLYKRHLEKKKRYKIPLEYDLLPKPGPRTIRLGKIAETNNPAYYELERLTTHAIVAGATGGGKSISAQVIVEEALMKNVAVVVFDPTAQWSGMLRKCTDKRMMSFYPRFGLKESDARGFPGNIRRVSNARQIINIKKYIHPGQIQIFACNKLDPSEIDIFVANVIRQIFRSDPEEAPELKVLFVFDEVHRLLSKFGGSGQGFLQIERACREFRKWGMGVMLVSQVLSDFVGEVKANINTEAQMRTIEESDLERIRSRYGEEFLKSLVRAEVGVGLFQNAEYNRGRPYFVQFRPILHNTRRLSDEELEKYNTYNDAVDDLEDQIDQLEAEKVDVFDLKMELKLVKDKIMTGNFAIVDIYLEGLKPRVEKQWEKLGKKPKKRELQLVDETEIQKSVEEAKKARDKFVAEQKKNEPKEEKKEEKKENMEIKIVRSLTFDNGIMVSSLKELKEYLPTMEEDIFKVHVNEKKNDIAQWIGENISKEDGEKLKAIITKKEIIDAIDKIGKENKEEKIKDNKDSKDNASNKDADKKTNEDKKDENKEEDKEEKKENK
ncbi:MAG: helicase HerA domain-containing protein [Candidatus Nanoarchaeia archaeon]